MSREMAQHLYNCQTGTNSPGLLAVSEVSIVDAKAFAILKLEKEQGIRVHQEEIGGKITFNIEHLSDLMLTGRTKVFKIGLFISKGTSLEATEGIVSDQQRGYKANTGIADFFLKRFLGCKLKESAEVTTKNFFKATESFINEEVHEAGTKTQYVISLLAVVGNQEETINPRAFAESYLDINHRRPYIDFLERLGVPDRTFNKDIHLIRKHIQRVKLEFENGLILLGTPDALENQAKVTELDNGLIHLEIEDRIKNISGK